LITYQRNIVERSLRLLPEQETLDERLEREVGEPEVRADDRAGDDHDDGAGEDLALVRPIDLLQLGCGLGDEAASAASPTAPARLCPGRLLRRADLLLPRASALSDALLLRGGCGSLALASAAAALLSSVSSHRFS
jgi:hypothetical protein